MYCTDYWKGFETCLGEKKDAHHLATKTKTKKIEGITETISIGLLALGEK
ncbi:MAG: hypothetical protein O4861_05240 [Trichodesmium sp. St16_bin4-tuft]|nr:hypothetical protein [Trichodesmium erythraeum GBRTRLIN201]MCH2051032.1 hypothetical protein [Trichodesmium sp. ALOHA_ZT_67]MDE5070061.1 hypothetical protein [Trichodesmium sp. St4_bin8_1]MDE5095786.1 hypothetical protein [Trichodesmium sp. St11_bin5]MDE5097770.1 hypothetical protein [Trichodesmium sp. St16_bin4-tuft]